MKHIPYLYLSLAIVAGASSHHNLIAMQRTQQHTKRRAPCSLKNTLLVVLVAAVRIFSATNALADSPPRKSYDDMDLVERMHAFPLHHQPYTGTDQIKRMYTDARRPALLAACFERERATRYPKWSTLECLCSTSCTGNVNAWCASSVDAELYASYQSNP